MIAIAVAMSIVTSLVVGIVGLVCVGIEGRGADRAPRLADRMSRAARHLNGEGRPPRTFIRLFG